MVKPCLKASLEHGASLPLPEPAPSATKLPAAAQRRFSGRFLGRRLLGYCLFGGRFFRRSSCRRALLLSGFFHCGFFLCGCLFCWTFFGGALFGRSLLRGRFCGAPICSTLRLYSTLRGLASRRASPAMAPAP